tara:strand:- start:102 stop:305 length:204 start_codon:yes stop_codon:yes gene_type:complete
MLPYPSRKWLGMFCDKIHLCETAERNEFLILCFLRAEKAIELIVWLSDDTFSLYQRSRTFRNQRQRA